MTPIRMERLESAPRIVLAFNEAFNRHDVAGMMQLVTADCRLEAGAPAPDGAVHAGKEAVTAFWQDFFRAAPQAHNEIEELLGFGFNCVTRWQRAWVDASGQRVHVRGADVFKLKSGLIGEQLTYVKGAAAAP